MRKLKGFWLATAFVFGFGLSLFHLYTGAVGTLNPLVQRAVHLTPVMVLVFLLYPAMKSSPGNRPSVPDLVMAVISAVFGIYFLVQAPETMQRMWYVSPLNAADQVLGVLAVLLLLEATRRTLGMMMLVTAVVALLYASAGAYIPGLFGHPGFNVTQMVDYLVWSDQGIFGIALGVSATFVALFVILGAIMTKSGITDVFRDISIRFSSRTVGGPAKIAVIFSSLVGTVSGSSAANVYTTGTFTIPLMKANGYKPHQAGAIEATASCGGQIMPPVMGAGAFVMAEFLGISYAEIMAHALIPAILYYVAVFMSIHFLSLRMGMKKGLNIEDPKGVARRLYMLVPLAVLVVVLMSGDSAMLAAYYGCISALVVGILRILEGKLSRTFAGERIGVMDLLDSLYIGGTWLIPMTLACAAAGIVVGVLSMTGLGMSFVGLLISVAGNSFWLIAFFVMVACILLGMGMPTTTAYILAAAFAGPALIKLGVPALVTHFFIFYFAVFANITPPVAVASYAGAQLAQASIASTSWTAIKIGFSAMIIPYMFLINPALLGIGTPLDIVVSFGTALIGVLLLSAGTFGWLHKRLGMIERALFAIAGVLFMYPAIDVSLGGAALFGLTYLLISFRKAK